MANTLHSEEQRVMTNERRTDSYSKETFDPSFDRQIDLVLLVGLSQFQFLQMTMLTSVRERDASIRSPLDEVERV